MFPFVTRRSVRRAVRRSAARLTRSLAIEPTRASSKPRPAKPPLTEARAGAARKPPGRFVEIDGLRVHVIVRGRGRPVVLLHGNGTMAEDFAVCGLIDRLAGRYRVVAIDRPGFGHTGRPRARSWSAAEQAGLVHRVLGALKVERPLVIGHSWGTLVCLTLAAGGLRDLRGLVLMSGYYYPGRRADVLLSRTLAVPGIGDAARALMNPAMRRLVAAQAFRHVFQPQAVPPRFEAGFPVEIAVAGTQLRAAAEDAAAMNAAAAALQGRYASLRCPVAFLSGDADAVVDPREQSMRLHGEVAGSTLVVLAGVGHMMHYAGLDAIEAAVDAAMASGRRGRMRAGASPG